MTESKVQESFQITTACVDCCFAKFVGDVQEGCELNRLNKFRDNGTEVSEVYNDDKEFFVVKGFCNGHRNQYWKDSGLYHRPFYKNPTDRVREENKIRCGFNVLMNESHSMKDLEQTINSIVNQEEIKPHYIIVSCSSNIERFEVVSYLQSKLEEKEIKFFFVGISEQEATRDRCLDISFSRAKNGYYAIFSSGYTVPKNFLTKLNYALNEEMCRIVALKPFDDNGNGLFMNATTYKLLRGNNTKPIMEKILVIADAKGGHGLVKEWDELPDEPEAYSNSSDS